MDVPANLLPQCEIQTMNEKWWQYRQVVDVCSDTLCMPKWLDFCIYAQWQTVLLDTDLLIWGLSPSVIMNTEQSVLHRFCDCKQLTEFYTHNK